MSSLIFFFLNTQNLFIIFLKAKDYHSFPGTYGFLKHMLPTMFVLLQALWENNEDFSLSFLFPSSSRIMEWKYIYFDLNPMTVNQYGSEETS